MPTQPLLLLLEYYKQISRFDLIQHLIINLNLKTINTEPIIAFCLTHTLFKALVYACNLGNNDFLTPFVKFFSLF